MSTQSDATCARYAPYDVHLRSATPHPNPFLVDLRAHLSGPGRRRLTSAAATTATPPGCSGSARTSRASGATSPSPRTRSWTATPASCAARPGPTPGCTAPWASTRSTPATSATRTGRAPSSSATRPTGCGPWATCRTARRSSRRFAARLAGYGYNHVFVNAYAHDTHWAPGKSHPEDYGPPPAYAWEGTNAAPDHLRLNVRYWRVFDLMMAALFDAGLTAHLYLKVYNKDVTWPAKRSLADDLFFGYVVARYGGYSNVVWDFAKESYNERDKGYCENRLSLIKALDGYRRLVTTHDDWALHFDQLAGGATDFVTDQKHDNFAARIVDLRRRAPAR